MDVEARVEELERSIERTLGASDPDPAAEAARLRAAEAEVLKTLADLSARDADLAGVRGHPVLAESAGWRELAERVDAPAAALRADELAGRLIEDVAAGWRADLERELDENDPDSCFHALATARTLDLEALVRRRAAPPLARDRPALREALLHALRERPPDEETRDRWALELLDRADVVLTSIDDVETERARDLLDLVSDDLTWHAHHVETGRGWRRRRLRRRIRRLRAERQERDLQFRLERVFGPRNVARFERVILYLIVFVLALLFVEVVFIPDQEEGSEGLRDSYATARQWIALLDTAACVVFLWDIAVRLRFVRGKGRWTLRHLLVDILPSIPFAGLLRSFRALRFLRLPRLLRFFRVFGFLSRGIDRIVRKYGDVLNRNIVLYPTREERARMERGREGVGPRLRRLQARLNERWARILTTAPPETREAVARARVDGIEAARAAGALQRFHRAERVAAAPLRDRPADEVLSHLANLSPEEVEADMGQDFVARVARAVRIFSLPPIRWLPFVRRCIPRLGRGMDDGEVVVAAAHKTSRELRRHHNRWLWFADLYGTITPAQFVDRLGNAMVKASFRPAYRVVLFALAVWIIGAFVKITEGSFLYNMERTLKGFLYWLGGICLGVLALGWWMRRIAGQATEFFEQSARAQFLALTESIKGRYLARDAGILDQRVFAPERIIRGQGTDGAVARAKFAEGVRHWLLEAQPGDPGDGGFNDLERTVLLYRDGIDGALFADSDTRTTAQLLGNPALRNLRILSERFDLRDHRTLHRLDLERQKVLFKGPFFWFSLQCRAVAHGVARLIVDYNSHALPKEQLDRASPEEAGRHRAWLAAEDVADVASDQVLYVTTHFTALHFLDDDPKRDAQVEASFGPEILERLRRDRRHLFRRIFGTYPLHKLPREERVLNLYRSYQRWLAGGRALLLPFYAVLASLKFLRRFVFWVYRCIGEIRRPTFQVDVEAAEGADYRAALRKIYRMRGPVAEAAMKLRAMLDPEYLGVRLPGTEESGIEEQSVEDDLRFLGAPAEVTRSLEKQRERAARDMVRLGRRLADGTWQRLGAAVGDAGREHLRAAACAYLADLKGVRRYLSAQEILAEVYERAARGELIPRPILPRFRLRGMFTRYWAKHGAGETEARLNAWRATVHNVDGVADALKAWDDMGEGARVEGERRLAEILRHPERITEKLVTLRAVQTLSLIDMLNYRGHVYRLGDYAGSGDRPGRALELA